MSDETIVLDARSTALLIVDMQNDFCSPDGYYAKRGRDISPLSAPVVPVRQLLERARSKGVFVVFSRLVYDETEGGMEQRHVLKPRRWTAHGRRLIPGSWGADVLEALSPLEGDLVLDKRCFSAFEGTSLERNLRDRGIRTLLLCGVVTYACVLATAFAAFDRGFDVLLVSDAVGSWDRELGLQTSRIVDLLLGYAISSDRITL